MKPVIAAHNISKKFCRNYKKSIHYAFGDIFRSLTFLEPKVDLRFGEFWAVNNVSFDINPGEALGIVGANGSGKTTLLRIVSGLIHAEKGTVDVRGRIAPLFARGAGFDPILTGLENIKMCLALFEVEPQRAAKLIEPIIDFSELPMEAINAPVKTYSSGMFARLGFSCMVHIDPAIVIIDEALAVGDMNFRVKCYKKLSELKEQGVAFAMVSHNPNTLLQICTRALYLENGILKMSGDADDVLKVYEQDEKNKRLVQVEEEKIDPVNESRKSLRIQKFYTDEMESDIFLGHTGRDLKLRYDLDVVEELKELYVHVILRDLAAPKENVLHIQKVLAESPVRPGEYSIQVDLPELSLRPGTYTIKTFFSYADRLKFLDFIENTKLKITYDDFFLSSHYQSASSQMSPK